MNEYQELVQIKPQELTFPFELNKEIKCSFEVANKTNEHVAFKIRSTSQKKYRVSPNHGLFQPRSNNTIVVTMHAQADAPTDMICKDKFLVQTIIATKNTVVKKMDDVTSIMRGPEKVHEVTLSVAYVQQSDQERINDNSFIESIVRSLPGVSLPQGNFGIPETIDEEPEGEGEEEEATPISSQNSNEMEALLRAEVQKRKKIEKELANIRKELENNKILVKELEQKIGYTLYEFQTLKEVTKDFAESCKIGEGGFGVVYKAILDGKEVAIKKVSDKDVKGFNEEIDTLSKVRHPNIITLIGACHDKENRLLVYEYLPKGSLEDHLTGKKFPPLLAETRMRVALDICRALVLLHSIRRVHGDLKPDNILLDSEYVSKLSDFGTCRALEHSKDTMTLFCNTVVKGTPPYMDPNFAPKNSDDKGSIGPWFDVYSFGVVLLRLATGRDVHDAASRMPLKESVEKAILKDKNFDEFVDVEWPSKEAPEKMARLGLRCFDSRWRDPVRPDATQLFNSLMDIASNR